MLAQSVDSTIVKLNKETLLEKRIPAWVKPIISKAEWCNKYSISDTINPFYLEADFNGDKQVDVALFIINKENNKAGIMIVHRLTEKINLIGAGDDFGMGDDMVWVNVWSTYREKEVRSYMNGRQVLALKNPAIKIMYNENMAAYIYNKGKRYKTFVQVE